MAAFDLQEQEQIATMKAWWEAWGKSLAVAIAIALIAFAGWTGFKTWQKSQLAKAVTVYAQVEASLMDEGKFKAGVALLKSDFAASPYAPRAALAAAKMAYLKGDAATARTELTWAIDNAKESALRDTAKMRLASILAEDKKYPEALALVKAPEEDRKSTRLNSSH